MSPVSQVDPTSHTPSCRRSLGARGLGAFSLGALIVMLCAVTVALPARAQSADPPRIDTIVPAPGAVQLRSVWTVRGNPARGGEEVGAGLGALGDIDGDGLQDFAVQWGWTEEWRVFHGSRGAIDTVPAQTFKRFGLQPLHPVVGDFYGSGHNVIGFSSGAYVPHEEHTYFFYQLHLFRTDSSRIHAAPSAILDVRTMKPQPRVAVKEALGADLDGDGDDELIIYVPGPIRDEIPYLNSEIWIYRGGPDFSVEAPTLIIRDSEADGGAGRLRMFAGKWDGDELMDLATINDYADGTSALKIYFGAPGTPWSWTAADRVVRTHGDSGIGAGAVAVLDCDGDGILDVAAAGPDGQTALFLSSRGKDARSRSFQLDDADLMLRGSGPGRPVRLGHLNDKDGRYEMLGIIDAAGSAMLGLSGGPYGPDRRYELSTAGENVFGAYVTPIGDATGDGYEDFLAGNAVSDATRSGVATLFSGGPYIPDDFVAGVERIGFGGHVDGVTLWPNPIGEELHISWRDNLVRRPDRFEVHDMLGNPIAAGRIDASARGALWRCAGLAAGSYVLGIRDGDGALIATALLRKM